VKYFTENYNYLGMHAYVLVGFYTQSYLICDDWAF